MMNMYYFYNKEKYLKNKEATEEKWEIFKYEGLLTQKQEVLIWGLGKEDLCGWGAFLESHKSFHLGFLDYI